MTEVTTHLLADVVARMRWYKTLAERAFAQVDDAQWAWRADPDANSIAVIVKHMAGNMRSRWTDFLTTDGEKPDRGRDGEFEVDAETRAELMAVWEDGWACTFAAIESLGPDDGLRTVEIRGRPLTVVEALNRQLAHYAYHVGQIVLLARMQAGAAWESLSIPRGGSDSHRPA